MKVLRILRSDFYKTRHTYLPLIHIVLPAIYFACVFFGSRITFLKFESAEKIYLTYITILTCILPVIISLVTGRNCELEKRAGNFQNLICGAESKKSLYLSKMIYFIVSEFIAVALAVLLFRFSFSGITGNVYTFTIILIVTGSAVLYIIHFLTALYFGTGAGIGLGVVETLLALLFTTGLGDSVWYFIPAAWASRLPMALINMFITKDTSQIYYMELRKGLLISFPITIVFLVSGYLLFAAFQGRRTEE